MLWEEIITIIIIFGGLSVLVLDKLPCEIVFLTELILFWNFQIINSSDALLGFSNSGLISIACLYIVVHPLSSNIYVRQLIEKVLRGSEKLSLLKINILIGLLSAFLNNTPLIQLITPIIREHSRKNKFPSSRFLMPISFSSIIGGLCSAIGTSTNLIILSLIPPGIIGFFDLGIIGVPFFILFSLYTWFLGDKLLPVKSGLFREVKNNFVVLIKSKTEISIKNIFNNFGINQKDVIGVLNDDDENISFESMEHYLLKPEESICIKSDSSLIAVILNDKNFFIKDCPLEQISKHHNIFYECVLGNISDISKENFEKKYSSKILALRSKKELLQTGDTLLILSNENFYQNWIDTNDFFMISQFKDNFVNNNKLPLFLFLLMISISASGLYPIEKSAMTTIFLYIIFKIININDALKIINYNLLLIIGCSFGISLAMEKSGLSLRIAEIIGFFNNPWVVYCILQMIAQFLTEVITNNAVAVLLVKICLDVSKVYEISIKPLALGLMLACSCSFITPYGYATNLIVQGPGGYQFKDYVKYGLGIKIISLGMSFLIPLIWRF